MRPNHATLKYCQTEGHSHPGMEGAVKVAHSNGVAWYFIGHPIEKLFSDPEWIQVVDDCDCMDKDECNARLHGYWSEDSEGFDLIRDDQAIVCMVGDDRWSTYDAEELTALPREEYCGECGQIGCQCDGYDREDI